MSDLMPPVSYVWIAVPVILLFIGTLNYFFGKKQLFALLKETRHTFLSEWHRLLVLSVIAIAALISFLISSEEIWFHAWLEFLGVIILFLIVEHALKRLKSGISDPGHLPVELFIREIAKATEELILVDAYLDTLLLYDGNCLELKRSLRKALSREGFSVRILITSSDSSHSLQRAADRRMTPAEYNKKQAKAKQILVHMREELIDCTDEKDRLRIQIREYKKTLPFAMYAVDGKAYVSFFPIGKKTTESNQLYIPNDTELAINVYNFFCTHFESMWSNEKNIV